MVNVNHQGKWGGKIFPDDREGTLLLPLELGENDSLVACRKENLDMPEILGRSKISGRSGKSEISETKPGKPEISEIKPGFYKIPSGKFFLFYGQAGLFSFFTYAISQWLLLGENIVLVDGANCFNPYALTRLIRGKNPLIPGRRESEELLEHIYVSRAFTAHQLEALVVDRLEEALETFASRIAVIYGCLNLLYDEDISWKETNQIFSRILRQINSLKEQGTFVLGTCPPVISPPSRKSLLVDLKSKADRVFFLRETEEGVHVLEENLILSKVKGGVKVKG